MPTATDLVTDLPADFEVFGQAVATSMGDLLGGSSGYILSKASATDMDFTWIANDQGDITGVTAGNGITVTSPTGPVPTVAIDTAVTVDKTTAQTLTNKTLTSPALTTPTISTATTNGDLLYGTGSGALQRLGIGSTSNVLTVTGGVPVWSAPSGGGFTMASFTPTYTNLTLGNGTAVAYSGYSGDIAVVQLQVTFGSTTSISGNVTFSNFPHTAKTLITDANNGYTATTGTAIFTNASYSYAGMALVGSTTGRAYYITPPLPPDHTSIRPMATGASPISFTTGSVVQFSAFYWKV